jgi:hypothetical protein
MGLCTKEWEIKKKRTAIFSVSARRWRFRGRKTRRTPIPRLASQECSLASVRKKTPCHGLAEVWRFIQAPNAQTTFLSEIALF